MKMEILVFVISSVVAMVTSAPYYWRGSYNVQPAPWIGPPVYRLPPRYYYDVPWIPRDYGKYEYIKEKEYESKLRYYGKLEGACENTKDGLYYIDEYSFAFCSNGQRTLQPCAEGAANPPLEYFTSGGYYGFKDFCSVNLLAYGYQLPKSYIAEEVKTPEVTLQQEVKRYDEHVEYVHLPEYAQMHYSKQEPVYNLQTDDKSMYEHVHSEEPRATLLENIDKVKPNYGSQTLQYLTDIDYEQPLKQDLTYNGETKYKDDTMEKKPSLAVGKKSKREKKLKYEETNHSQQ